MLRRTIVWIHIIQSIKLIQILKSVNQYNSTGTNEPPASLTFWGTPYTFIVGTGITTILPTVTGTITTANMTTNSLTLNWTKAADNITSPESLQYKVVRSSSDNINTATDAETNGTTVLNWTANIATANATSLSVNTTYSVTITTRPTGLSCSVFNATGTASANVSNISITCIAR